MKSNYATRSTDIHQVRRLLSVIGSALLGGGFLALIIAAVYAVGLLAELAQ